MALQTMTVRQLLFVLLTFGAAAVAAQERAVDTDVQTLLAKELRFSRDDLAALRRGDVVKHGLPSRAPGEIAVVGAVRVHASKEAFFARVRDIVRFKSGPDVLQIGRFSTPPMPDDLAGLTVDKDDFDVRACRLHDCGIRLSAAAIERVTREVDVKATDAQARGAAWFKQMLLEQVTAYASGGARMTEFDDGDKPIRPADEFDGVVANMPEIAALMPSLVEHLRRYPDAPLPDAEDFLYWSKEKFGIDPFITVTHVTIVCLSASTCVMTTRDVYSSRYLDASVALAIASDVAGAPPAFDLVYDNRSRANALKGGLSGLRRSFAERRARSGMEENLRTLKKQLEKG
jgi:hypothetical protein